MIDDKLVYVATPMYGGMCTAPYTVGMLDTLNTLQQNGYKLSFSFLANESLITRGRNSLVDTFLKESNAKYFLFIDADIKFTGSDVLKLIKTNKELICGIYPKKVIDWDRLNKIAKNGFEKYKINSLEDYAAAYVVNTVDLDETHDKPLTDSVVEIKHGGTGFMMIQRSVFEKLSPHVKEYRNSTIQNSDGTTPPLIKEYFALDIVGEDKYFLSEDYFFCELWRKHGGKVHADLSINLSHLGTHEFKGSLMLAGSNPGNH